MKSANVPTKEVSHSIVSKVIQGINCVEKEIQLVSLKALTEISIHDYESMGEKHFLICNATQISPKIVMEEVIIKAI